MERRFTQEASAGIIAAMAILKIARMGMPVLAGIARPVEDPTDPKIHRLVADMIETLADLGGVGLAAPQVHVPLRVMIFHVPANRSTEAEGAVPLTVLINPQLTPLGEEMVEDWEGCLSLPGLTGLVPRYRSLRYRGVDLDGREVEREARDFHARVVQHEYDHLDGVLYPRRLRDPSQFGFVEEIRKALAANREQP